MNKLINIKNAAEHLCTMYKALGSMSQDTERKQTNKQIYGSWSYGKINE